ncbi:hypothetical protein A2J03_04305 [Rhodococcus sp. EPR-157]|uniref:helix-turn-helix domain-containing protein n=1 Tax=Rhodococcus sp. EPR-157 TaxID=1813677 RepID=UPI0007BC67C1|nr:helix-turn-helix domain-containing protein [Rhodococcus sp. EPR-157]KZF08526.1 hypothetical protein A2J03_04305 [Rhodococcus sp. EPR-157]
MHDLAGRLDDVDPVAAQAIRVIHHFDQLTLAGVGIRALLKSAAELTGCPVGVVHGGRTLPLVIRGDGTEAHTLEIPLGAHPVPGMSGASIWLDRLGPAVFSDPYVLDRLASAVSTVLSRTATSSLAGSDIGLVEILIDRAESAQVRHSVAARLGLSTSPITVIVTLGGRGKLPPRSAPLGSLVVTLCASADWPAGLPARAAWAIATSVVDVPAAFDDARAALRVTASTGESGATRIAADDLGALKLLAQNADSPTALREVQLIDRAAAACGWVEDTIIALATSDSRRAAGAVLGVHHSTLQQRIVLLSRLLDYSVQGADGRLRAYLAVMLRRARRNDW